MARYLIVPLNKAWSDSARQASADARRKGTPHPITQENSTPGARTSTAPVKPLPGGMHNVNVTENTTSSTKVENPHETSGRMKRPDVSNVSLNKDERPIDYGHVNDLMKEKYGPVRGDAMYHAMIDNPSSQRGLHFVVGQQIQSEKKSMMASLGKTGSVDSHHYQGLYKLWSGKS